MSLRKRQLALPFLFIGFVWLLISTLEPLATGGWVGPVPAANLERHYDAGALFYTEVDLEFLKMSRPAPPPAQERAGGPEGGP